MDLSIYNDKMAGIDQLIEISQRADMEKADYRLPASKIDWMPNGYLAPEFGKGSTAAPTLKLSKHALTQVAAKLGPVVYGKGSPKRLPVDFLDAIMHWNDDLWPTIMYGLCNKSKSGWMVRRHKDTCRAIVDGNYPGGADDLGRYENSQYLEMLLQVINDKGGGDVQVIRSHVDQDLLICRSVWKETEIEGRGYGLGCMLANDETGNGKIKVLPLVQVTSCTNSLSVDTQQTGGIERTHQGDFVTIKTLIAGAMADVFHASADVLKRLVEANYVRIPSFADVLDEICHEHNWTTRAKADVVYGAGGEQTIGALVNGITYAAHGAEIKAADGLAMELFAGALLFTPNQEFARLADRFQARVESHRQLDLAR